MTMTFVRHDIDPAVVADAVERKVAEIDRNREMAREGAIKTLISYEATVAAGLPWNANTPEGADWVDPHHDRAIEFERTHYGKVRIIERIDDPLEKLRFRLIYGDVEDSADVQGTGPFSTFDKALAWFTGLGR